MNWQQKALALCSICPPVGGFSVHIRKLDDWYVHMSGVSRKEGGVLSSGNCSGRTPEVAVDACWEWATNPLYYLVLSGIKRRSVKWNGFMWEDVNEDV